MPKKNWKAAYNSPARRKARHRARLKKERLAAPITKQDVLSFTRHLLLVCFREVECWFYVPVGRGQELPEWSTVDYATATFHGVQVNAHRFALAAHLGVTYASLKGWDVHHIKGCAGYRCQNPAHLEKAPMREHRGTRGVSGSLIRYQIKLMESAVGQAAPKSAIRTLAGVSFRIRTGTVESIIKEEWTAPKFEVLE